WRVTRSTDLIEQLDSQWVWDESDLLTEVKRDMVSGEKSQVRINYNNLGFQTQVMGPAPASQFNDAPISTRQYDEGIAPLVIRAWNNADFSGAPQDVGTGQLDFDLNTLSYFTPSNEGWSALMSTVFISPVSGDIALQGTLSESTGHFQLLVNDAEVIDGSTVVLSNVVAGDAIPLNILVSGSDSPSGALTLEYTTDGEHASGWQGITAMQLTPGLGLVTSESNSEQLSSNGGMTTLMTTRQYQDPMLGNVLSVQTEGNQLSLTYDDVGEFGRLKRQALNSGLGTDFTYYGAYDSTGGPSGFCSGFDAQGSAGQLASLQIDSAGKGPMTMQYAYDRAGVKIGEQSSDGVQVCYDYDERYRLSNMTVSQGGDTLKSIKMGYHFSGSELVQLMESNIAADNTSSQRLSQVDLRGQLTRSQDEWGSVLTQEMDLAGQTLTRKVSGMPEVGEEWSVELVFTLDDAGRPLTITRSNNDGTLQTLASMSYQSGELSSVDYGNDSQVVFTRNAYSQVDYGQWSLPNGGKITDYRLMAPTGRVLEETLTHFDGKTAVFKHSYDRQLRLISTGLSGTQAALGSSGYQWQYDFDKGQAGKDGAVTQELISYPDGSKEQRDFSYHNADGVTGVASQLWPEGDETDDALTNKSLQVNYDESGYAMTSVERADGATLSLNYDEKNDLIQADDNLGNQVIYTRDAQGHVLAKQSSLDGVDSMLLYSLMGLSLGQNRTPLVQTIALPGGAVVSMMMDESRQNWGYNSLQGHRLFALDVTEDETLVSDMSLFSPYGERLGGSNTNMEGAPN
uniref:hypothetical protein n=1 Tax=uncultured Shewanella sp. TaxID=173975 RepID=UPI0026120CC6